MKCFYHPAGDAVGLCSYCQRGLCADCAAESNGRLACKGKHESEVAAIGNLVNRNVKISSRTTSAFISLVYWIATGVFGYIAWTDHNPTLRMMLAALTAIMLVYAAANTRGLFLLMRRK